MTPFNIEVQMVRGWIVLLVLSAIATLLCTYTWVSTGWLGDRMQDLRGPMILPTVLVVAVLIMSAIKMRGLMRR